MKPIIPFTMPAGKTEIPKVISINDDLDDEAAVIAFQLGFLSQDDAEIVRKKLDKKRDDETQSKSLHGAPENKSAGVKP